jgi:hypothetical protein
VAPVRGRGPAAVLAAVFVGGCSQGVTGVASPPPWPAAPYAHDPMHETSVAQPVATGGDVDRVAAGLASAGFFCAQVRANDVAVQVWCRLAEPSPVDPRTSDVTTVDLVATTDGAVEYARVQLPERLRPPGVRMPMYADRLRAVLGSSAFLLWPEDADDVEAALTDLETTSSPGWDPTDPRPAESRTVTTDRATYRVAELPDVGSPFPGYVDENPALTLTLATPLVQEGTWPYGSEHYATTTVAAAPGLEAGGFDCYGPAEQPCTRPAGNQQIDYRTAEGSDRILTVSFQVGGGVLDPVAGLQPLGAAGFPEGLTFLSDEVRAAVEERVEGARLSGESFIGIVAGVVVVLDAGRTPAAPDGTYGASVAAIVGTPLVEVPSG